jgi:sec-independent protein translocase protein TatA
VTLLFFDFGSGEILLILLVAFLIFGPDKIPELARSIGKFINDIKRASEDIKTEVNREADRREREKKLEEYESKMSVEQDDDVSAIVTEKQDKSDNKDQQE